MAVLFAIFGVSGFLRRVTVGMRMGMRSVRAFDRSLRVGMKIASVLREGRHHRSTQKKNSDESDKRKPQPLHIYDLRSK